MILKALYDYYNRCDGLPKFGMEAKEIGFIIVLSEEGKFLRIENLVDGGKGKTFFVKKSVGRSSGISPNYLYDSSNYVFGLSGESKNKKASRLTDTFNAFKSRIAEIYSMFPAREDVKAVSNFYSQDIQTIQEQVKSDPLWPTIEKSLSKKYAVFSFRIEYDNEIIAEKRELLQLDCGCDVVNSDICLITGEECDPVATTTATMVPGSQATAKLVSFQIGSGYDSYGKSQGSNAPISPEAEFAYTTALKHLLRSGSRNKFLLGTTTFVFWGSSNSEAVQQAGDVFAMMFDNSDGNNDNPNENIENAQKVFKAIYSGTLKTDLDDWFYILGLKPNAARISVCYWSETPLRDFAQKILQHFEDMEIEDYRSDRKPYSGLRNMLSAVTLGGKVSDATPNLPETVARSIFQGLPYPQTLFSACIRRIRAEQDTRIARMAILKAYLNRLNDNNNKKINKMLDKENTNVGYLCGRLFAVMDKLQYAANGQSSIRSSYMSSASSTPAAIFPTILKLSNSHFDKLAKESIGLAVHFDKQKEEIASMIQDFPETLSLKDQGRFFLGYYHQKNFKKENETEE